jgi:hypothetical protein
VRGLYVIGKRNWGDMRKLRPLLWVAVWVGVGLQLAGCAKKFDEERVAFSPDGKSRAAVVRYSLLPSWRARVRFEVETPRGEKIIVPAELKPEWDPEVDNRLGFAEIAWTEDSRYVSLLAVTHGSNPPLVIWVTYDTVGRNVQAPGWMAAQMRQAIRENYAEELREEPETDPLRWMETEPARVALTRRRVGPDVNLTEVTTRRVEHRPFTTGGR